MALLAAVSSSEPITLHRSEVDYGGLGGAQYSRQFGRYLQDALDAKRAVDDGVTCAWWANPYVHAQVRTRMTALRGGGQAYVLLLAYAQDRISWREACDRYAGSPGALTRMYFRLHGFADQARYGKHGRRAH